jgi:hypothetical protein
MEAWLPLPAPEWNEHWDPTPMRCSVDGCRNILETVHPASRGDSRLQGYCPEHGQVPAIQSPNSGIGE